MVCPEFCKQCGFMDGITEPSADACCIIKDNDRRYASDKAEDVLQPLADAFSGLAAEYLAEAVIAVWE